jgi:CHASE3 domain sensor protein
MPLKFAPNLVSRLSQSRLSQAWQHLPLRKKGVVLAVIPVLALLISASFAFLGNRQRERTETDVTRHFELVSDLEELLTLVVNAETGVRGYLLTRRPEFLLPYQRARTQLAPKLAELRAVVAEEPGEEPRLAKSASLGRIQSLVERQMQALDAQRQDSEGALKTQASRADASAQASSRLYTRLSQSKSLMDSLRQELRLMRAEENRLLDERLQEIAQVRRRDYIAIGLSLLVGLIGRFVSVYLFNTGIVRRVQHLKRNVRCLGQGQPLPFEPSDKKDALGELEREVANAHASLVKPRQPN